MEEPSHDVIKVNSLLERNTTNTYAALENFYYFLLYAHSSPISSRIPMSWSWWWRDENDNVVCQVKSVSWAELSEIS